MLRGHLISKVPYVECLALAIKQHVCQPALALRIAVFQALESPQHTKSDDGERGASTIGAIREPAHDWRVKKETRRWSEAVVMSCLLRYA